MGQEPTNGTASADQITAAARLLGEHGFFGALWLDERMLIRQRLGRLADGFDIGDHVTASLLVLVGQEERIEALRQTPDQAFSIPNIALMAGDGAGTVRMNVSVVWREADRGYLVLLGRVLSADFRDLVVEDEIRKRRIADAELARINEQLEEFAYVISHDLKAPLRAIRFLSGDLGEALDGGTPDPAVLRHAASEIGVKVRRMSAMLEGLLEYARIGRQSEAVEETNTAALIANIVGSIPVQAGMTIEVAGAWPLLRTVAVPLDLVLRNLIENAVKHHDRKTGRVTVRGRTVENALIIEIADDGPGIAPEWHEAIFEPFRRVDDTHHPDSRGIGLALVKRTVESVGGRIEVRSDPAKARGTTFQVTWPKRLPF